MTRKQKSIFPDNGYFDDCPICQAMKKKNIRMKRYDDGMKNSGIWKQGFSAAEIKTEDIDEIKEIVRKHGGIVVDNDDK